MYVKMLIEYFMLKHKQIAKRVDTDQHTPAMNGPMCRLNNNKTTTKNQGMPILNVLLTQQGTHKTISAKGIRFKRMSGELSKSKKRKRRKDKVAKAIGDEDDCIEEMFHDSKDEESKD
ncbi:hypothetical protein Tco_1086349, partial [Tanacetum coccineum]